MLSSVGGKQAAIDMASPHANICCCSIEDGKEMNLDCENLGIKGVVEEIDRHSRVLQKQSDLRE
jgi:large subunit ribosomal protein L53